MGDYYASLESRLNLFEINYVNAYNDGDYARASKWLYALNMANPSKAFVTDMPKFVMRSNSLRSKLDFQSKAQRYCDYWHDVLEVAMVDFREKNQADYNRV